jgi:hypothetical protein
MTLAAVDIYHVFSIRHIILNRLVPVQLLTELIEIDNLQLPTQVIMRLGSPTRGN